MCFKCSTTPIIYLKSLYLICYVLCFVSPFVLLFLLPSQVEDWRARASRFLAACDDVALLHSAVVNSINRAVLYDIYPYIWDLRNTLLVAKAFICWLGKKRGSRLVIYVFFHHAINKK